MMNRCEITQECGLLAVKTPYIPELVDCVKSLPYADRRYDATRKIWLVDPKHGYDLVNWIKLYAGEVVSLPSIQIRNAGPVMRMVEVRYIGACKFREDGSSSAFGLVGRDWSLIFPESVLRAWFDSTPEEHEPTTAQTLYQVLGIKKTASQDEVKTAFRRMARQWHPDVCKEPNAHEVFIRVKEAADILSDTNKRARYDAGLKLQKTYEKNLRSAERSARELTQLVQQNYRSPLRCGLLMVEGVEKVGRLEVTKILAWEDIMKNGKTLVVSWPMGAKEPVEIWS
jgi:hypothetical protein